MMSDNGTRVPVPLVILMSAAIVLALWLRRRGNRSFWTYVIGPGALSWAALYVGGFHPALVPIVPFMPHSPRDFGIFDPREGRHPDTLNRFEHWWATPVQLVLLLFGFANARRRIETTREEPYGFSCDASFGSSALHGPRMAIMTMARRRSPSPRTGASARWESERPPARRRVAAPRLPSRRTCRLPSLGRSGSGMVCGTACGGSGKAGSGSSVCRPSAAVPISSLGDSGRRETAPAGSPTVRVRSADASLVRVRIVRISRSTSGNATNRRKSSSCSIDIGFASRAAPISEAASPDCPDWQSIPASSNLPGRSAYGSNP